MEAIFNLTNAGLLLGDVVTIYLFCYMHRNFYNKREWAEKNPYLFTLVYIADLAFLFGANLCAIPTLNLASITLAYLIPMYVCFEIDHLRGLLNYVFYLLACMTMEITSGILSGGLTSETGMKANYDLISPEISIMMNLMEIMIVLVLCRFSSRDKGKKFDKAILYFMTLPFLSVSFIIGEVILLATGRLRNFNGSQFIGTSLVLVLLNLVVFVLLEKYLGTVKRDMELEKEKMKIQSDADLMEIAARSMNDRLNASEEALKQDRFMRHDRRHFEAMMLMLLENGNVEEARKCLEERLAIEPRAAARYCENPAVNAAIAHYVSQAEKEGIEINVQAHIPTAINVDEMELAITISNLLENAIHACVKLPLEERYIRMNAKYKNQLLLEVENACGDDVELDEDGYPLTHEQNHGIGTRSVLAFAAKNDCDVVYIVKDHVFKVRLLMGV